MTKYVFAYHGGKTPETPEEGKRVMAAWETWFENMGAAVADPGHPVGQSKTVSAAGVADNGGANPLTGVTFVNADTFEAACDFAKGCPIIDSGGTVEVAEVINI